MDELNYFQGRRVLVTGHTGFQGAWLSLWLLEHGATVIGYSADMPASPNLVEAVGLTAEIQHHAGNILDLESLTKVIERERPEVVFHLAAQTSPRAAFRQPKETFDVNVGGTVNVLEAVRRSNPVRVLINVTSDRCYENRGWVWGYRESDPIGGGDPYGASKGCAELVFAAYRQSYFAPERATEHGVGLASVRAGNMIGGGDWALDRIVPDCLRALTSGKSIRVRQPHAVRPWQHVLEALAGYLVLAARLGENPRDYAGSWNFGPPAESCRPVADVVKAVIRSWGSGRWQTLASSPSEEPDADGFHLCSDKALSLLPWRPQWNFTNAVERTVEWYRAYYHRESPDGMRELSLRQIRDYETRWSRSVGGSFLIPERVCA